MVAGSPADRSQCWFLASLGQLSLPLLVAMTFAETGTLVGFVVPGDTVLFTAGTLMAVGSLHLPFLLTLLAVTAAAVVGDQVAFLVGRRYGARALSPRRSRWLSPRHVAAAESFMQRFGAKAVVVARFVPLARTLTPVVAGVGAMSHGRFLAYNAVGALGWAVVMLGGGTLLGTVPIVSRHIGLVVGGLGVVSLVPAVVALVRHSWSIHCNRSGCQQVRRASLGA